MKWIFSLLLLSMLILAGCTTSELPPEPNAPGATGNYYKAIGDWATAPSNFYFDGDDTIECSPGETLNLRYVADDDFVYFNVFAWDEDGQDWDTITLDGDRIGNSNWISGEAVFEDSLSCSEALRAVDDNNEIFVVAYTCSKRTDGSFDCKDNKWQLEIINVTEEESLFPEDPSLPGSEGYTVSVVISPEKETYTTGEVFKLQ